MEDLIPADEPYINCAAHLTWGQIAALLEYRLTRARVGLEMSSLDAAKTESLRGEIRCLKSLLDLPNEAARRISAPPDAPY